MANLKEGLCLSGVMEVSVVLLLHSETLPLHAAFEFFTKLGVKYCTFHNRDMSPKGSTLEESNSNLDEMTDLALHLQNRTGVKVLWVTCNLFAHSRYMNRAAANPDCHVLAYAGAQVKKGLDVAKMIT
uniref:xylose isomerase-like n=1 Tax=Oncorhynchus gorbuscha TaxID=8017 RepID=UPI001EAF8595|nr:xylose isomerase-like [Oncorhynchus gorbuscha]